MFRIRSFETEKGEVFVYKYKCQYIETGDQIK